MKILDNRHYQNYKLILTFLGQWPYQSLFQQKFIRCVIVFNVFSILIPKLIKCFESTDDIDLFIECIPMICLHIVSLSKYFGWIINFKKMRTLLHLIEENGHNIRSEKDIKIMQYFIEQGRVTTTMYSTSIFIILILCLITPTFPKILDIIQPLNTSRDLIFLYQTEYFVDQHKYYVPILLHAILTVPVSVSIIIYYDNVLATYTHYTCGIFTIIRSYLRTLHLDITNVSLECKRTNKIYQNIVRCVKIHRHAIEFSDTLESFYSTPLLIVLLLNMFIIALTGTVGLIMINNINEGYRYFAFGIGAIGHLLYLSYQGQKLIEKSEMVFTEIYCAKWYEFPPRLQRLLIPIMMRSITPCQITAGKVVMLSMDTFSIVLKNSMSFFTLVTSIK